MMIVLEIIVIVPKLNIKMNNLCHIINTEVNNEKLYTS